MGYKTKKNYGYTGVKDADRIREDYFLPSTLEDIDGALFDRIKNLEIQATSNTGFNSVPVIWVSAERSFQVKNNRTLRDSDDQFILPVISVERNSFEKSLSRKGGVFGNAFPVNDVKGGSVTIARRINQDKTANFARAASKRRFGQLNYKFNNPQVIYETITIPLPIYVDVSYTIRLQAEYQQQMNDMMAPFVNLGYGINYFTLLRNGHKYEAFVDGNFQSNNNANALGEEERMYQTDINIKVLGHIIGADKNQERPKIVRRENMVDITIGRERAIFGDIPDHLNAPEKYRS